MPYDLIIKYRDREFDCEAIATIHDCRKPATPFTEEFRKSLREFVNTLGDIEEVTIRKQGLQFKKGIKI